MPCAQDSYNHERICLFNFDNSRAGKVVQIRLPFFAKSLAKRNYDFVRFGRSSPAKKASYDYIRFGKRSDSRAAAYGGARYALVQL
ncbi:hypothetical protein ANCCEY_03726 [Ancylostoma ceylanicum]|uniref:Uncharacterized protein n=1 Tax=Ancylostoma ceylanicum TaxID=53326 RepID=A0A0D6LYQ6_9BILA|nr:hypothetical protein ANCCEY_03726 [Ancylostoma ceylanicum]